MHRQPLDERAKRCLGQLNSRNSRSTDAAADYANARADAAAAFGNEHNRADTGAADEVAHAPTGLVPARAQHHALLRADHERRHAFHGAGDAALDDCRSNSRSRSRRDRPHQGERKRLKAPAPQRLRRPLTDMIVLMVMVRSSPTEPSNGPFRIYASATGSWLNRNVIDGSGGKPLPAHQELVEFLVWRMQ